MTNFEIFRIDIGCLIITRTKEMLKNSYKDGYIIKR